MVTLREELDETSARLDDADRKRSAAEHTATRLGEQVDDLRAFAADIETACVKVSPELLPCILAPHSLTQHKTLFVSS